MTSDDWLNRGRKKKRKTTHGGTDDQPSGPSEGKRKPSWIWMSADTNKQGDGAVSLTGMSDALRIEFLQARGRSRRYNEEVRYAVEEKCRVAVSLEKTALLWDVREGAAARGSDPIQRQERSGRTPAFRPFTSSSTKGAMSDDEELDNGESDLVLIPATAADASDNDEDLGLDNDSDSDDE
ncbi:hypothetical protein PsYK624_167170 [Phanerochaete sordida]|uniref:Uncharacterized protein n=1 Tax=Phanerochaete sordida TaxID=48140 RepID=A0A9P3GRC8_9APHY|nr:hypothetical protein PsYK624_167170 [Phanerochaete sordida]